MVFTLTLTDYALPDILGGGTNDFVANAIYDAFFQISDAGLGSALAVMLVVARLDAGGRAVRRCSAPARWASCASAGAGAVRRTFGSVVTTSRTARCIPNRFCAIDSRSRSTLPCLEADGPTAAPDNGANVARPDGRACRGGPRAALPRQPAGRAHPRQVLAPVIEADRLCSAGQAIPLDLETRFWNAYGILRSTIEPATRARRLYRCVFYASLALMLLCQFYFLFGSAVHNQLTPLREQS